jgi:hypothetical protein
MLFLAFMTVAVQGLPNQGTAPQSAYQQALVQRVSQRAAAASAQATAQLLSALDTKDVRKALRRCCPEVANSSATALLRWLEDEIAVAEVVTSFPATGDGQWNPMLKEALGWTHLENQWEVRLRAKQSFGNGTGYGGWFGIQDDVETKLYGLKPFTRRGAPTSLQEAAERGPYCAVNVQKADGGSPLYGSISVVLNRSYIKNAHVISAIDSGEWTGLCNGTSPGHLKATAHLNAAAHLNSTGPWPDAYSPNCSAYNFTLGTLEHFHHLVLGNIHYWSKTTSLASFVKRFALPWGRSPLAGSDFLRYWELIPVGVLEFPQSVQFIIGDFPSLFGTSEGRMLQNWCRKHSWALVWSLSLNIDSEYGLNFFNVGYYEGPFPSNKRMLDPTTTTSGFVNISATSASSVVNGSSWNQLWRHAHKLRRRVSTTNQTWTKLWRQAQSALPQAAQLATLHAGACKDTDRCFGLTPNGDCVCYSAARVSAWTDELPTSLYV